MCSSPPEDKAVLMRELSLLLTPMQDDLRQLERAGAASESHRVLDAADTVRHDARGQGAGPGSPRPRAAGRQKATLC